MHFKGGKMQRSKTVAGEPSLSLEAIIWIIIAIALLGFALYIANQGINPLDKETLAIVIGGSSSFSFLSLWNARMTLRMSRMEKRLLDGQKTIEKQVGALTNEISGVKVSIEREMKNHIEKWHKEKK